MPKPMPDDQREPWVYVCCHCGHCMFGHPGDPCPQCLEPEHELLIHDCPLEVPE